MHGQKCICFTRWAFIFQVSYEKEEVVYITLTEQRGVFALLLKPACSAFALSAQPRRRREPPPPLEKSMAVCVPTHILYRGIGAPRVRDTPATTRSSSSNTDCCHSEIHVKTFEQNLQTFNISAQAVSAMSKKSSLKHKSAACEQPFNPTILSETATPRGFVSTHLIDPNELVILFKIHCF